jgi:hypothetical protein
MPNWVTNEITFNFDMSHDKDRFMKLVTSDDNPFDFDKIVPMPDNIFRGNLGTDEREKYGSLNWYDWSCENWGTKWNSRNAKVDWEGEDDAGFIFDTAWSAPTPIANTLKSMFRGIKFRWFYRDEGDMFCGYLDDDIGGFENGSD